MAKKKAASKKPRRYQATEATWINVRAVNKKIADLTRRVESLERWERVNGYVTTDHPADIEKG